MISNNFFIQRVAANLNGRDFVCGDIHGSYSCVERFLKEINFNKEVDRFFCCGDLIDRGPENEKCLHYLFEPWFFMTKGNHEEMMETYCTTGGAADLWTWNGGNWGAQYFRELDTDMSIFVRGAIEDKIANLPALITVEKKDGTIFHVMHAELWNDDGHITDADLADIEKFEKFATIQTRDGNMVYWGRRMFYRLYDVDLNERYIEKFKRGVEMEKINRIFNPNLSHIYSGHTKVRRPVQFYGQTNLDTMAYDSYSKNTRYGAEMPKSYCGLTVTEPETGQFWKVNDSEFTLVEPVVII